VQQVQGVVDERVFEAVDGKQKRSRYVSGSAGVVSMSRFPLFLPRYDIFRSRHLIT